SPNSETGVTIQYPGTGRADLRFNGSVLKLVANTDSIPPDTNGIAIDTSGNVGIGITPPTARLDVRAVNSSTAVHGVASLSDGYGAILDASTGSQPRGIWARSKLEAACANCRAGVFDGSVDVNGTLRKSANLFRIDHPLDPANKYLSHSVVEAPV